MISTIARKLGHKFFDKVVHVILYAMDGKYVACSFFVLEKIESNGKVVKDHSGNNSGYVRNKWWWNNK